MRASHIAAPRPDVVNGPGYRGHRQRHPAGRADRARRGPVRAAAGQAGTSAGGYAEILEGVRAGERVVVSANFLIDAESNLKRGARQASPPGSTSTNDRRPDPLVGAQPRPGADRHGLHRRSPASTRWRKTPLDAIPDLSDVQVIVYTEYPGQAPQVVEDQVTYPLTTAMLGVPHSQGGARPLVLRRVVRLRHLRGRHRHLLGALARPGVPELRCEDACRRA